MHRLCLSLARHQVQWLLTMLQEVYVACVAYNHISEVYLQGKGKICITLTASQTWLLLVAPICQELPDLQHQLSASSKQTEFIACIA